MTPEPFTISPARYAEGKLILSTSDGSGYKTRAAYLAESLGGKYVGRSNGYTMSPAAIVKFKRLWDAGFEAHMRLYSDTKPSFFHRERRLDGLTAHEALRAIGS